MPTDELQHFERAAPRSHLCLHHAVDRHQRAEPARRRPGATNASGVLDSEDTDLHRGGTLTPRPGVTSDALLQYLAPFRVGPTSFRLACGQGPTLRVDGATLQTQATGTYNFLGFQQVQFATCGQDATLTLPAGTHLLEGNVGGLVKVAAVSLSPSPGAPYAPNDDSNSRGYGAQLGCRVPHRDGRTGIGLLPDRATELQQRVDRAVGRTDPAACPGRRMAAGVGGAEGIGRPRHARLRTRSALPARSRRGRGACIGVIGPRSLATRRLNQAKARGARGSISLWGVLVGVPQPSWS